MNKYEPLNTGDVLTLSRVIRGCHAGAKCEWIDVHGHHNEGVMRHITSDERGYFLTADDDVRDAFVRISGMFETFLPVPTVCSLAESGMFAIEGV